MISLSLFQFMDNVQPSKDWIVEAWSIKPTFSLIITFSFIKLQTQTKKPLTQLLYYCCE